MLLVIVVMKLIAQKPLSPANHGLLDYAVGLAMLSVPVLLGAEKKIVRLYGLLALEIFLYGALTKHKFALKPLIPLKTHYGIDLVNIATMALLSKKDGIKNHKSTFRFNLAMLGIGLANVLLTDWKNKRI